jgi:hypothetical protein
VLTYNNKYNTSTFNTNLNGGSKMPEPDNVLLGGTKPNHQPPRERYRIFYKDTENGQEKCTYSVATTRAADILLDATEGPDVHSAWIEKCEVMA